MRAEKLIRMANEIAAFFRPYPEEEAIAGIRHHIRSFWTPKMRATLRDQADLGPPSGLDTRVIAATRLGPTGSEPTAKEAAGPAEAGQVGSSDAG